MSPETLRVAIVQDAPTPRDLAANLARAQSFVEETAADLIVLPELFLTGYQTERLDELALTPEDPRLTPLAAACRAAGRALLTGFVAPLGDGFSDAYLAIDRDGAIREPIHKTHLFGSERAAFRAGDALSPITLCGTRIGVINCFEIEFPEVARTLAMRGAEVLVAGSANMHPYTLDHRIAAQSRALENRLALAYANRVGAESGHDFCGGSCAVSPDGALLGELDDRESGTIIVTVPLRRETGGPTDMLAQRRPELYA